MLNEFALKFQARNPMCIINIYYLISLIWHIYADWAASNDVNNITCSLKNFIYDTGVHVYLGFVYLVPSLTIYEQQFSRTSSPCLVHRHTCQYPRVTGNDKTKWREKKSSTRPFVVRVSLKGHYDEVIFSRCHFFNKWLKIIFIYPYGKISSPFLNKKPYTSSFQQKFQMDSWTIGKLLCHAFWLLISVNLAQRDAQV